MRTRVKICGITRLEDALEAARLGADAIGFVFYPDSPRNIAIEQASRIRFALPPFLSVVALFVDPEMERVREVMTAVRPDALQFHGHETPQQCRSYGMPYIKAIRMEDGVDVLAEARRYHDAQGLLLDTYVRDKAGGTGQRFDWTHVPADLPRPVILAGGLAADNVAQAVGLVKPWALDVSGGVESSAGIKDAAKMAAFIDKARGRR